MSFVFFVIVVFILCHLYHDFQILLKAFCKEFLCFMCTMYEPGYELPVTVKNTPKNEDGKLLWVVSWLAMMGL